jgi:galactokinase
MEDFRSVFSRAPSITASAPGRVNLIGEHTDYNGGFVLPTTIPQKTHVELAPRDDDRVRAVSAGLGHEILEYQLGREKPGRGWLDYVQGLTQLLRERGHELRGFDLRITSEVPLGSGLSSSAALSVSLLRALRQAFAVPLDDLEIARLGQQSENRFVGAQVGVMDPMVCSLGESGRALFVDARSLQFERIILPAGGDLLVIHSGVAHNHAGGDYNTRRGECERAAELVGVAQLRDLNESDLARIAKLPAPLDRRARHVVTENARVLAAVAALREGDWRRTGELFFASHDSQRDDYEVSVPEIDLLIALARQDREVYGARLTGGGFGGSVVMVSHAGRSRAVANRITDAYFQQTRVKPTVLVPA